MTSKTPQSYHWVTLSGDIKADPKGLHYTRKQYADGPGKGQLMPGVVKSNAEFENGTISFEAKLTDPRSACQVILNHGTTMELYVGLNFGDTPYGMMSLRDGRWETVSGAGFGSSIETERWLPVRIYVRGSRVELFVDDVLACKADFPLLRSALAFFFHGSADTHVRRFSVQSEKPRAFVVMQFTQEFNELYTEVIKPTCEEYGFECIRADEEYTCGLIIQDITKAIR